MNAFFIFLIPLSVIIVAVILMLGLLNMAKGGSPERSQKLMRYRIIAQAIAVIFCMIGIYMMAQ